MFGKSKFGALGISKNAEEAFNENSPTPTKLFHLSERGIKIKKLALGWNHSIALSEEGEVYTWGEGRRGKMLYRFFWPSILI